MDREKVDRYLRIMHWTQQRYTRNGVLVLKKGSELSPYVRIEILAFAKVSSSRFVAQPEQAILKSARKHSSGHLF